MRSLQDLADDWVELLLQGLSPAARHRSDLVRNELLAYARRLAQWRSEERLEKSAVGATSAEHAARRALEAGGAAPHEGRPERNPEADAAVHFEGTRGIQITAVTAGDLGVPAPRFTITPEMFQRFSRLTGMDSTCLVGTAEHRSDLMLYLAVFSLLTSDGDPTDLEMQRLLKKLRLCREQFQQSVTLLFAGRPAVPRSPLAIAGSDTAAGQRSLADCPSSDIRLDAGGG